VVENAEEARRTPIYGECGADTTASITGLSNGPYLR
jgi:hypothetical protein